jgi:FKBP-type peptidyl-prolyl cis-trans isomerase 2
MPIKKGDFVKISFTGRFEDGSVFDTTDEKVAKESKAYDEKVQYKPILIVVGRQQAIRGLDESIEGMDAGQSKEVTISPEKGFGERNPDLIVVVPIARFEKENINPVPGMLVTIDEKDGMVRSVGGGRVIVDFNHPLSGKTLKYSVKIEALLSTPEERVSALFDDAGLAGSVSLKKDIVQASVKADPSTDYIYKKQTFLSWMREIPEVKKITFNEEYELAEAKPQQPQQ